MPKHYRNPSLPSLAQGGQVLDPDKTKQFVKGFGGGKEAEEGCPECLSAGGMCMAHGGEASGGEDELHEGLGQELLQALEAKDHKGLMSCVEAIVLSMKSKE